MHDYEPSKYVPSLDLLGSLGDSDKAAYSSRYFLYPETTGVPVERTHAVFKDNRHWLRMFPEIQLVHAAELSAVDKSPLP